MQARSGRVIHDILASCPTAWQQFFGSCGVGPGASQEPGSIPTEAPIGGMVGDPSGSRPRFNVAG